MAATLDPPTGRPLEPLGFLDVRRGDATRSVAIFDQLFVGRECAGISAARRLVIPDPEMSHTHCEVRLDATGDQAFIIDTSTNGTLLNGARLVRAVPVPLRAGDEIRIGDVVLTFRSDRFVDSTIAVAGHTEARIDQVAMVMVVGDIVNYSTISQRTDEAVMARSLNTLWQQLGEVLRGHQGTLSYYAGDALFATWELHRFPDAAELGIGFALAADELVARRASGLPLRAPDGAPIRMGWGVVAGMAAVAPMSRSTDAVIGDAANVAFRLAGLAGRDGRAAVLATRGVPRYAATRFNWGEAQQVELKGRLGTETVVPVAPRRT